MYDRALKQFQEDINYGQLEEMSYNERFAFLLGFETSLKTVEDAIALSESVKKKKSLVELFDDVTKGRTKWTNECDLGR